jgi:hypothetical protein
VNITRVLTDARGFNVAASMLQASGVASEFEADEHGAGITPPPTASSPYPLSARPSCSASMCCTLTTRWVPSSPS